MAKIRSIAIMRLAVHWALLVPIAEARPAARI
jgi:hypothetical protein